MSINPKDLTNEELEYVIKTGKIPPKFAGKRTSTQGESTGKAESATIPSNANIENFATSSRQASMNVTP